MILSKLFRHKDGLMLKIWEMGFKSQLLQISRRWIWNMELLMVGIAEEHSIV